MDLADGLTAAVSGLALASSAYLWVLQRQRESSRLRAFWSGRQILWSFRGGDTEQDVGIGLTLPIVVGNLSALPDAILGVRLSVWSAALNRWLKCRVNRTASGTDEPLFPVNLPPRTTQALPLEVVCSVPLSVIRGHEIASEESYEAAQTHLGLPLRLRVEVIGLDGHAHTSEVVAQAIT